MPLSEQPSQKLTPASVGISRQLLLNEAHDLHASDIVVTFISQLQFVEHERTGAELLQTFHTGMLKEHVQTLPGWKDYVEKNFATPLMAATEIREFLRDVIETAIMHATPKKNDTSMHIDDEVRMFHERTESVVSDENILPDVFDIVIFERYLEGECTKELEALKNNKDVRGKQRTFNRNLGRAAHSILNNLGMAPDFKQAVMYALDYIEKENTDFAAIQLRFIWHIANYLGLCNSGYPPELSEHWVKVTNTIFKPGMKRNQKLISENQHKALVAIWQFMADASDTTPRSSKDLPQS